MINVAVIGVGNMGALHARVYSELNNVNLAAVCDLNKDAATAFAEKYRTKAYSSIDELLAEGKIDAVSIAVPTKHHFDVAKQAIEKGKHVLVEKPITETIEQAKELIDLAKKHNVKLMVGHVERFNPAIQFTKDLISKGGLGKIFIISARRVGPITPMHKDDVTLDLSIHDIDILHFLVNQDVQKIYCDSVKFDSENRLTNAFGILKFSEGTLGVIESNYITQKKIRHLYITAENASVDVDFITQDIEIQKTHQKTFSALYPKFNDYLSNYTEGIIEKPIISKKEPLKEELSEFVASIIENREPSVSGLDGLNALKIAFAFNDSVKSGKPVIVNE